MRSSEEKQLLDKFYFYSFPPEKLIPIEWPNFDRSELRAAAIN